MLESTLRRYNILTVKILLACFPPALIVKNRIASINHFTLFLIQHPIKSCFKNKGGLSKQDGSSSFISSFLMRSVYKAYCIGLSWGCTMATIIGKNKMEKQTPITLKTRMKPRKRQNAPFPFLICSQGERRSKIFASFVQDKLSTTVTLGNWVNRRSGISFS